MDRYERKARLLPALLPSLIVAPIAAILISDSLGWLPSVSIGGALGATCAVGLAYAASGAGRHFERRLWPRWPHDAPTNRWLHPDDDSCSQAQKNLWYAAIEQRVGLSIPDVIANGDPQELERVINDAVRALRYQVRDEKVGRLVSIHNEDYGFARNLAGLNFLCWLPTAGISTIVAWTAYFTAGTELIWGVLAAAVLLGCTVLLRILDLYVRQRADRYTESLLSTLDQSSHAHPRRL